MDGAVSMFAVGSFTAAQNFPLIVEILWCVAFVLPLMNDDRRGYHVPPLRQPNPAIGMF